jgi:uncharacterized membrane protein
MKTKKIWQSKVFWISIIGGIISLLSGITPDFLHNVGITNPTAVVSAIGTIIFVLNIVLRWGNPAAINNSVPSGTDIKTMGKYMNK